MKLIVLNGDKDSGKTTTLNILYQLLLYNGAKQFMVNGNALFRNLEACDFLDVLEYNGLRIGVVTVGDYYKGAPNKKRIRLLVNILIEADCDIIICAATGIGNQRIPKEFEGLEFTLVEKQRCSNDSLQRIENGAAAKVLFNMI